jgi:hypothetical protein
MVKESKGLGACQASPATASPMLRTEPASPSPPSGSVPAGAMPGPWSASEMGTDRSFWDALAADDVQIVRANWDGFAGDVVAAVWADDDHDDAATAHLIAAAPDLYEAVELAVSGYEVTIPRLQHLGRSTLGLEERLVHARAALRKARGEG